jgi:hypothetical protein
VRRIDLLKDINMKKIYYFTLISVFLMGACSAPVNTIRTIPVRMGDSIPLNGYVYSIPMTTIKVEAEIITTHIIRGPFYRYAEKNMGIRNVPQESSVRWDLGSVRLETVTESDPEFYYLIRPVSGNPDLTGFFKLCNEGLIVDLLQQGKTEDLVFSPGTETDQLFFKDVSINSNVLLSSDTLYKTIMTDSTFIKVPVLRDQLIVRTIDEKAREAADLIFKLRKRRFHMISANYDIMPQGVAMEHALRELEELEKEYLSLFIGKKYTDRETLSFYLTPDPGKEYEILELFEMSRYNGLTSMPTPGSETVSIKVKQEGKTRLLKGETGMSRAPVLTNSLYYRVPDMAAVEVSYGEKILIHDRIPVYQYGAVLSLPLMMGDESTQ